MTTCHVSSHRFNYLLPAIPNEWTRAPEVVEKTMLWDMPTMQVWWECHDGVVDGEYEQPDRPLLALKHRDKNKKFMYVKPNFSPAQTHIVDMIHDVGGEIVTCAPWSYYGAYDYVIHNKELLRKNHIRDEFVVFLGGLTGSYVYDRHVDIKSAVETYGSLFVAGHDFSTTQYLDILVKTKWMLQPHGVGPRHSTYEAMCMGVPSLIPPCDFWKDYVRECCVVYEPGKVPTIDELNAIDYVSKSEACIDMWEKHMTAEAIVRGVLESLK